MNANNEWNTRTDSNKLGKKVERNETLYLRERFSEDVYMFNIAKYHEVEDYGMKRLDSERRCQ
ncbi:hypothetical protein [Fictibacillus barbaricus]|uniref:hypothetical protein n=1 Tax=Fictibacillus barbaricus TaxID=182136 RepID=UPI001664C36E|nr:hypothetical protein [Fictibacillus barbaricus]GGB53528.1 hypothetical protein GCM10007199_19000 [Fictibacillus barbaricus]